jgi:glycosyltransferase involved in cell wall biosynthesis
MKVSFVIPFHNEEKNCPKMMKRVAEYAKKNRLHFEIIPVDDRSNDNTKKIIKDFAHKFSYIHPVYRKNSHDEEGNTMGKALIEGTRAACGEYIIWTMGDLADDTDTYGEIIKKLEQGYELVFGSRYMPGGSRGNLDPLKAFLSSWGTVLSRLLFGVKVHDITNAFRGFKKKIFVKVSLSSSGFSISPEFAIKAHLAGFKLGEVPTVYTNRVEGLSNFKIFKMTKNYISTFAKLFIEYRILNKTPLTKNK